MTIVAGLILENVSILTNERSNLVAPFSARMIGPKSAFP